MKFHISKSTKNVLLVVLALLVVLMIISYFTKHSVSKSPHSIYDINGVNNDMSYHSAMFESFENETKPKVMLFHATWCGHCEQYLSSGIFDKVATNPEVQNVSFEKYDADKNEALREKYDITGFPTIIGLKVNGEKVQFDGNRNSVDDLISFAKSLT